MNTLTIIAPVYNEANNISPFFVAVQDVMKNIANVEPNYIFVDDGSTDDTLSQIKNLRDSTDVQISYVSFSRNFGKEAAMYAGLTKSTGDYVTLMDIDLQDPPELLIQMFAELNDDVDVAVAVRESREGEPFIRSVFSKAFYTLLNRLSTVQVVSGVRDFRLMKRKVVNAIVAMPETTRFSKGIFSWVGFPQKNVSYKYVQRAKGKSKWSFWSLTKYAVEGIVDFSETPLLMVSGLGIVSFALASLGGLLIILRAMLFPDSAVFGWPSMVVLILAVSGIQLFSLGVVGRYISSIFIEVKKRPVFIVREEG